MLKEIFEQPRRSRNCLRGRAEPREGRDRPRRPRPTSRRELVAGQAIHPHRPGHGLARGAGRRLPLEDLAKVATECTYACEFRYRNPIVEEGTVVVAISQSGETADTLAALREAKEKGALALGVVNVVGSTIARETDAGIYLHAGPEIGVATTKAFTCQLRRADDAGALPRPAQVHEPGADAGAASTGSAPIPDQMQAGAGAERRDQARSPSSSATARTGCSSAAATTIPSPWKAP